MNQHRGTTVRSELRAIRRTEDDLPPRRPRWGRPWWKLSPLIWAVGGLLLAAVYAAALIAGGPPARLAAPAHSVLLGQPIPHH